MKLSLYLAVLPRASQTYPSSIDRWVKASMRNHSRVTVSAKARPPVKGKEDWDDDGEALLLVVLVLVLVLALLLRVVMGIAWTEFWPVK